MRLTEEGCNCCDDLPWMQPATMSLCQIESVELQWQSGQEFSLDLLHHFMPSAKAWHSGASQSQPAAHPLLSSPVTR